MTRIEQDLRQVLGEQGAAFSDTLDTTKLRKQIARRSTARRTGAVVTAVGVTTAAIVGIAALPFGDAPSSPGRVASSSATASSNPDPRSEPSTPMLRDRPLLQQRRVAYSLEPCVLECATRLTTRLTLQSLDDVLAITLDKKLEFGTFIRRDLTINGQVVGSGDIPTKREMKVSRVPLWAVPDYSYEGDPARISETRDWRSLGIRPGHTFTVILEVEYKVPSLPGSNGLTPDPSYPQHISGHVTVGLYGPPVENAES